MIVDIIVGLLCVVCHIVEKIIEYTYMYMGCECYDNIRHTCNAQLSVGVPRMSGFPNSVSSTYDGILCWRLVIKEHINVYPTMHEF